MDDCVEGVLHGGHDSGFHSAGGLATSYHRLNGKTDFRAQSNASQWLVPASVGLIRRNTSMGRSLPR